MPVGGEDPAHPGRPGDLEQQVVLVGGVEDQRVPRALVAHDEDIVLVRPDDELVDADVGGLVVGGAVGGAHPAHATSTL